jgi:heme/copper-type cytochrome/quinol oxidase subunit 4
VSPDRGQRPAWKIAYFVVVAAVLVLTVLSCLWILAYVLLLS